jgi:hypothetical protein
MRAKVHAQQTKPRRRLKQLNDPPHLTRQTVLENDRQAFSRIGIVETDGAVLEVTALADLLNHLSGFNPVGSESRNACKR